MSAATTAFRLGAALLLIALGAFGCAAKKTSSLSTSNPLRKMGTSKIVILMSGLPEDVTEGSIYVALWGSEESFMHGQQWVRSAIVPIARAGEPCVMAKLPVGTYSVSAFFDATNSGEFRRNGLGIPIDPWAISRGSPLMVPPSWEHSKFEIEEGTTEVELDFNHQARPQP
ncbi:MAG: DUF2141 domain-containing protein [Planctomycetes bacterium]|nr:DUF2141 domain-containing protein [Planctomycetota bacterium]